MEDAWIAGGDTMRVIILFSAYLIAKAIDPQQEMPTLLGLSLIMMGMYAVVIDLIETLKMVQK